MEDENDFSTEAVIVGIVDINYVNFGKFTV